MVITRDRLRIIGHRGWPGRFPDNVLAGIEAAASVADMVEVDIRRTADGVLVLSHDPHLGGHLVGASAWSELAGLDLGGGHHPLTLEALRQALPEFPLNLEVKNLPGEDFFEPDQRIGKMTADRAFPGDLVTCFHWPTVDAVRASHPQVATGLLIDLTGSLVEAVDHALALGHLAVVPHWRLAAAQQEAVAAAVEAGLTVAVWTLNDPDVARDLASVGVSAIITDDPGEMHQALLAPNET